MNVKEIAESLRKTAEDSGVELIVPGPSWYWRDIPPDAQCRLLDDDRDPFYFWKTIDSAEEGMRLGPIDIGAASGDESALCKISVAKSRFMTNVQEVERVWVRPKVPSKLKGRRGTRRAWKRANPPEWTLVAVGRPKVASLRFDPSIFRLTD